MELKRFGLDTLSEFNKAPAEYFTKLINDYIETAPTNWAIPFQHPYFEAPAVVSFGDGDAPEYLAIKEKYPWTLTPRECLENPPEVKVMTGLGDEKSGVKMPTAEHMPELAEDGNISWPNGKPDLPPWEDSGAIVDGSSYGADMSKYNMHHLPIQNVSSGKPVTCISIGLPIHSKTLESDMTYPWGNSPEMKVNSMFGAHCGFLADISLYLVAFLKSMGYEAIAPSFTQWGEEFRMDFRFEGKTSKTPISPCPEREWAVAGGLGTYGLHDMIITERGAAILMTTIITTAPFPKTKKPTEEYCLFYRNGSCKKCIARCPGQAISAELPGRYSANCDAGSGAASRYNLAHFEDRMKKELGDYADMAGTLNWGVGGPLISLIRFSSCARCYTGVPCATHIPVPEDLD